MREHEFKNKDCFGLHFEDNEGHYVGVIKRIEARVCLREAEGEAEICYYVSPCDCGDDWYDFKNINFITNGDYIRSKGLSGLWWVANKAKIGMDGKALMFTKSDGVDFVCDDFEKWLRLAYKGDFIISPRPEPAFDDWDSQHDPARRVK